MHGAAEAQASASSSAPPMQAPWSWQTMGFSIVSARFQASRHTRRNGAQALRIAAELRQRAEVHARGERRAWPRSTTQRVWGSSAASRSGCPVASTRSASNALRFSGRLSTT
jgi:hypothetical protein